MRIMIYLGCASLLLAGCTAKVEEKTAVTPEQVELLDQRLSSLETQIAELNQILSTPKATPPPVVANAKPSTAVPSPAEVTPEIVAALTDQVNKIVMSQIEATVDERIASQVGTADDIEAIFSNLVVEEIDAREIAEQREQDTQRREQAAERDTRGIQRQVTSAGLDEDSQQAVLTARAEMQQTLDEELPLLKERGATPAELLAAVAESRLKYESELLDVLDESELQSYHESNRWVQRDQSRLEELNTKLSLTEEQLDEVVDAYASRRDTLSDGFLLMSNGYLDRGGIHEGFSATQATLDTSLKETLTPEQFTNYEESGLGRFSMGHFGRGRGR